MIIFLKIIFFLSDLTYLAYFAYNKKLFFKKKMLKMYLDKYYTPQLSYYVNYQLTSQLPTPSYTAMKRLHILHILYIFLLRVVQ